MDVIPPITGDLSASLPIKYILCALIAGAAAKIYDDIEDNFRLEQFKTAHNMEMLKGIHYVTFTILGIAYPLFFIIFYFTTFMNKITTPSSYELPYENSLFYSFALLFLFLDYSKINAITNDEYYCIAIICMVIALGEKLFEYIMFLVNKIKLQTCDILTSHEVSNCKLITRLIGFIIFLIYYLYSTSSIIKSFASYNIAYMFVSFCTQFYSLYIYKPHQPIEVPPIIQEKKEEKVGSPEIKEDTDPPIITG